MIDRAMNTYFDALDSFDPTERGLTAARRVNANTEAETAALQHMRGLGVPVPHPDDYDYGEMWQSGYAPKVDARGRVPLPPKHYRLAQEGFDVSGWADDDDPAISSTLLAWNDQQDALRLKLSPRTAGPNLGVLTDNEMTPARAEYEQKVLERIRQQLEGPSGLQNLLDAFQTLGTEARDLFPNDPTQTHIYDIEGAPPAPESTTSGLDDLAFTGQRLNVAAVPLNSLRPWTASDVGAAMWQAGIDPTALRGLREQAAKIENVDQATLFINEQGLAVAHVRHGARIPDRYAKFASENNLELVVRDTYSGVNKPMPFEYRASGARYQNEFMDGRHLAAGAAGAAALGASGAASAGALPMKPKHQIGVWDKGQRGIYEDIVSGLLQKAGLSERGAMKGAQDLISGNTRSLGIGAADFDPITISEDVASAIKTNDWLGATLSALGLLPFAKPAAKVISNAATALKKPAVTAGVASVASAQAGDAEAMPFRALTKPLLKRAIETDQTVDLTGRLKLDPKILKQVAAISPDWDGKSLEFQAKHIKNSRSNMTNDEIADLIIRSGSVDFVKPSRVAGWVVLYGKAKGSNRMTELVLAPSATNKSAMRVISAVYSDGK